MPVENTLIKTEIVVDSLHFYKSGGRGCLTWYNSRVTFFLPSPGGNVASFPLPAGGFFFSSRQANSIFLSKKA